MINLILGVIAVIIAGSSVFLRFIEKIEKNGTICAVVRSDEIVITDAQSALDLLMTAKYELGTKNIVIDKKRIKETFFKK